MALQKAATLYPINSPTVDSGAAVRIRALDDVEAGATNDTQSMTFGTQGSSASRRWDPTIAASNSTVNVLTTNDGRGWAIPLSDAIGDMAVGSGVAWLTAQTVTVSMVGTAAGTGTGDVGANDVLTPRAALWKWNTSTDASTLIASASGTARSISAALAYSGTAWSASVAITVPETTFAANEVLFVVMGGLLACGAGLLGGARTTTWILSVDVSTTKIVFGTQGLRELAETTGSSAGAGTVTGVGGKVLGTVGAAAGSSTVAGVLAGIGGMVGSAAGSSTVAAQASSVASGVGVASGSSTVTGLTSIVLGTVGTVEVGAGGGGGTTVTKHPIYVFDD